MNFTPTFSPAPLSYMAALRGVVPGPATFAYASVNCTAPGLLIALAASNPQSHFYGLMSDKAAVAAASVDAHQRQVDNVHFLCGTLSDALNWAANKTGALPALDYLCCDESAKPLAEAERAALFDLATKALRPGGLLALSYRSAAQEGDALRFLVREFAPEMTAQQACNFLLELKKLGAFYFRRNQALLAKLDQAIVHGVPDEFFSLFDKGEARSRTFDTLVGLGGRGFAYIGDSSIAASYIELSVPAEAQPIIIDCRKNPLYETIKDFAQNRELRNDIWCHQPATLSSEPARLFGGFSFGITMPRDTVPSVIDVEGKAIPLTAPLYTKLIDLMTIMPVSIGDVLIHPEGKDYPAAEIMGAIQILVACGLARPMRGQYRVQNIDNIAQPRLLGAFNRYLEKTSLNGESLSLASPVLGDAITVSPREALVMQALDRAGLANSVSALLPELQRLAKNPAFAARVMDAEPTAESARQMIEDTVTQSIVQWYAYGLLNAA